MLRHGRRTCHAQRPACEDCALRRMCPWWRALRREARARAVDRRRLRDLPVRAPPTSRRRRIRADLELTDPGPPAHRTDARGRDRAGRSAGRRRRAAGSTSTSARDYAWTTSSAATDRQWQEWAEAVETGSDGRRRAAPATTSCATPGTSRSPTSACSRTPRATACGGHLLTHALTPRVRARPAGLGAHLHARRPARACRTTAPAACARSGTEVVGSG